MTTAMPGPSVHRIFLGWDGPALPRAAQVMAREYAAADGLDLRGVVVVTPAARAGRRLLELLLDEAEARGIPFTPPRTVTMGWFPELLYRATGPLADATTSRHAFVQALRTARPGALDPVFPTLPAGLSGWMALAGIVEGLHREVGAAGRNFEDVAKEIRTRFLDDFDDSSRWEALAKIQRDYLEILKGSGLRDRDRERKRALEEGRLASPGEVWTVGVVELPLMVRGMVEALPGPVRALIHAPGEIQDRFDILGCVLPDQVDASGRGLPGPWRTVHIPLGEEKIHVVRRPRDQAAAAVAVLRGFGGRFGAEEVAVGVPDPELVPFLEQGFSGAGVPHRFAGGTLLADTGPVRLLRALADFLDGKPFPAFATLIRHPDLHGLVEEAVGGGGPLKAVDRFQSRHLQATVEGFLPGDDPDARSTRKLVSGLDRALGLEAFGGERRLSEWMPELLELLVKVYGGGPLDRSNLRVRRMLDSLDHIKRAATRLATLPRRLDLEVGATDALAVLLAELTGPEMKIPPDPEEHAAELLGWLELPLDDARAVILTGVNDRTLPEAVGADPFLPGALRTRLGLPDDGARFARDAYLLTALLHSREEVHLVAGRTTAAGDPARPSRLLLAASEETVARRLRRYLGDEDPGSDRPPEETAPAPGPLQSLFRSPPQDPLPAQDSLDRMRVTDFSAYLSDPYRYGLTRVLGLEALDDGAREMDGGIFGGLAHRVLERFGRSEEAGSTEAGVVRKRLDQLLDHAARDQFGRRPLPAVRVQVEQLRVRLRSFAEWQAGWVREGWRVVGVEEQPEPGVPFLVDDKALLLRGKIDRIDHNAGSGEWAIFDYKTGDGGKSPEKVHRKGRGRTKEWVDLQLPLYLLLLPGVRKEDGTPVVPGSEWGKAKLGYILLPGKLEEVGPVFADWTEGDLEEAYETARRVVRELRANDFRYDPGARSFRDDPFDALLGRLELPRADDQDDEDEGGGA